MLAYYIVRNVNVFSNIIFALMVASMIIPFQAIMIPLVSVYGGTLNILNHRLTLIFMHTGFSMAMSVFMFHGFIRGSIPLALEEAAYIDGCTHTQTFFRIVFPLLKPIISTMVIMNAMAFWNDFLLPSLVLIWPCSWLLRNHHGRSSALRHPDPDSVRGTAETDHQRCRSRSSQISKS